MFRKQMRRAFTLIEIMVVIVVLGILATFIITTVAGKDVQAQIQKARSDIQTMTTLIESFRVDMRRYPTEDEGLSVLREPPTGPDANRWSGPYSRNPIPNDPWGNPYEYVMDPNGIDPYGIQSLGADGAVGGEGANQDINSWTLYDEGTGAQQ